MLTVRIKVFLSTVFILKVLVLDVSFILQPTESYENVSNLAFIQIKD